MRVAANDWCPSRRTVLLKVTGFMVRACVDELIERKNTDRIMVFDAMASGQIYYIRIVLAMIIAREAVRELLFFYPILHGASGAIGGRARTSSGPIEKPREKPKNPKGHSIGPPLSCDARKRRFSIPYVNANFRFSRFFSRLPRGWRFF
jgi:hypothetical protein